ncbi:hypothetical protein [Falsirhodobacter sp. 20TX0035]|uniref:hypothetical protein n=1 Tax=Falsirhodobacter sp. 20TX0035 TaxID=3022019 RepID=UPI00232B6949|nr:hypothetical protein [Falsirhodobacter sp. 20TX0035]MDB6452470.1 hypothetical protein [Falsirhodobacter sp. 20TX0035]
MIPLRLESFDENEVLLTDAAELEEIRRLARAEGRAEAEADQAAQMQRAGMELAETLSRSLQDMAFAWNGAREEMLAQFDPLLRQILGAVLPEAASAALGPLVAEAVAPLAAAATARPVRLVLHPEDLAALRPHLPAPTFPLTVDVDPQAPRGTVRVLGGAAETRIDPSAAVTEILSALDDLFTLNQELRHG